MPLHVTVGTSLHGMNQVLHPISIFVWKLVGRLTALKFTWCMLFAYLESSHITKAGTYLEQYHIILVTYFFHVLVMPVLCMFFCGPNTKMLCIFNCLMARLRYCSQQEYLMGHDMIVGFSMAESPHLIRYWCLDIFILRHRSSQMQPTNHYLRHLY